MSRPFFLQYYDPPASLARHVLAFFHFRWDEKVIADRHPGALGQFVLLPYGWGEARFGDRVDPVEGEAQLFAGFSQAAPFNFNGPWHAMGVSLTPLGWAALTGKPANQHFDRFIEPKLLMGDDAEVFAKETNDLYRAGKLSGEEGCQLLTEWIAPRFKRVAATHEALIDQTIWWLGTSLNPDMDHLFDKSTYSRRQTERLVERYFGLPPAAVARKYRAVRAASLLAQPELSDEGEAEIADAFYDQPHMVREIRRYCGYTPSRLGGPAEPLFQTMLRMKNLDRLKQFRAIG